MSTSFHPSTNNCGIGSGGFQKGNRCAGGGRSRNKTRNKKKKKGRPGRKKTPDATVDEKSTSGSVKSVFKEAVASEYRYATEAFDRNRAAAQEKARKKVVKAQRKAKQAQKDVEKAKRRAESAKREAIDTATVVAGGAVAAVGFGLAKKAGRKLAKKAFHAGVNRATSEILKRKLKKKGGKFTNPSSHTTKKKGRWAKAFDPKKYGTSFDLDGALKSVTDIVGSVHAAVQGKSSRFEVEASGSRNTRKVPRESKGRRTLNKEQMRWKRRKRKK